MKIPVSLHLHHTCFYPFETNHLSRCEVYLVFFICISQMVNDVKHLFMYLLTFCIYSFLNYLFMLFCPFSIDLFDFVFLMASFKIFDKIKHFIFNVLYICILRNLCLLQDYRYLLLHFRVKVCSKILHLSLWFIFL